MFSDLMKLISYSFMCSFNSLLANYKISTNIQTYISTHIKRKIKWNKTQDKITQQNSVNQQIKV